MWFLSIPINPFGSSLHCVSVQRGRQREWTSRTGQCSAFRVCCFVQHPHCVPSMVLFLFVSACSSWVRAFYWLDSQWQWCQGLPGETRTNPGKGLAIDGGGIASCLGGCFFDFIFLWVEAFFFFFIIWFILCSLQLRFCASFDLLLSFSSHLGCSLFSACSLSVYLAVCLSASLCVSLYLLSPSHSFIFIREGCSWLLDKSDHWGQLKHPAGVI